LTLRIFGGAGGQGVIVITYAPIVNFFDFGAE